MIKRSLWDRWFGQGSFVFHVTLLTGGTLVGQGLFVLLSPLLSRLYSPAAFGIMGVFVSTVGVLASVATLRYELAIPLPSADKEAWLLVWSGALTTGVFGVFLSLLSFWIGPRYLACFNIHFENVEQQHIFLLTLPLGVGILGIYQILTYWLIRYKRYRALAGSKVAIGGVTVGSQLGLGLLDSGGWGLVVGWILGRIAAIGVGMMAERPEGVLWPRDAPFFPGVNALLREMRRFVRFPLLSMPASLMNAMGVELPLLMSASLFGPEVAGWFAFARRIVYGPMSLIGRSVSQVYVGSLCEAIGSCDQSALRLFDSISRRLFLLAVVPFGLLGLLAPWLFRWIFGPAWHVSGVLIQYLAPAYLVHFVVVPLSQTLNLLERQDWQIAWDTSRLGLVLCVFLFAKVCGWSYVRTFMVYSLVSTFMYLVFYWLMRRALVQRITLQK